LELINYKVSAYKIVKLPIPCKELEGKWEFVDLGKDKTIFECVKKGMLFWSRYEWQELDYKKLIGLTAPFVKTLDDGYLNKMKGGC